MRISGLTQKLRILAVDDAATNIDVLVTCLEDEFDMQVAFSGEEALAAAELSPPDLILLDVKMPGMDGYETCRRLKQSPSLRNIPVVFVTALGDEKNEEAKGLSLGAEDFLAKPVNPAIVRLRVRNILDRVMMSRGLEMALTGSSQGLWETLAPGNVCTLNSEWAAPLGYAPGELEGKSAKPWRQIVHEADLWRVEKALDDCFCGLTKEMETELRMRGKDGSWLWVGLKGKPTKNGENGLPQSILGVYMDIGRRKRAEENLRERESRLSALIGSMQDVVVMVDSRGSVSHAHAPKDAAWPSAHGTMLGRPAKHLFPVTCIDDYENSLQSVMVAGEPSSFEFDCFSESRRLHFHANVSQIVNPDSGGGEFLLVIRDITERKRLEEGHKTMALHDPLTGLPNRRLLSERVSGAFAGCRRDNKCGALLFIDLDNFKQLNDSFGHEAGDTMLKEVASRLRSEMREIDTVARVGGDEFVVMLEALSSHEETASNEALRVGEKLRIALDAPYDVGTKDFQCSASIGVAIFHGSSAEPLEILKQSDMAMYQAKTSGRNSVRLFHGAMQSSAERVAEMQRDLNRELKSGFASKEMFLLFQPKVGPTGAFVGAEALVRWNNPRSGLLNPAEFIPMAETSGLIINLGGWVIEETLRHAARWKQILRDSGATISFNVSTRQFMHENFIPSLAALLAASDADPDTLVMEITESVLINREDEAELKLAAIKAMGLRISLDDFGSGYSSLSYLSRFDVDEIKLDQSFVRDLEMQNPKTLKSIAIVRAIVGMSKALGISMVAEGVETESQWTLLKNEGVSFSQGFLFSKPLHPHDIEEKWLFPMKKRK